MKELIDEIDVLMPSDEIRFEKLPALSLFKTAMIEDTTEKAALISYGDDINTKWFPKSQLRSDFEGNLYLSSWMYAKEIEGFVE